MDPNNRPNNPNTNTFSFLTINPSTLLTALLPYRTTTMPIPNMWDLATTPSSTETVAENYWPNIAKFLNDGQGPKPLAECAICCVSKLTIPGLQEPGPEKADDAGAE